jgi:hypothetical protein
VFETGSWWLTPVILVTQEAEIRRFKFQCQPREIVQETLSQKSPTQKRAGGMTEELSSNSSITKKRLVFENYDLVYVLRFENCARNRNLPIILKKGKL